MQYRRSDARLTSWHNDVVGDDIVRVDTVSPLDPEAISFLEQSWFDEAALPGLIRAAVQSRRLATEYGAVAGAYLTGARHAAATGDKVLRQGLLRQAKHARRDAHKCEAFALSCEDRGNELALLYGFSPASDDRPVGDIVTPPMTVEVARRHRDLVDC